MEIRVKDIENYELYEKRKEEYLDDPEFKSKPSIEFSESIVGVCDKDVLSYKIMSKGFIEEDKEEIKIMTTYGGYICNYTQSVHDRLKVILEENEKRDQE